MRLVLPVSLRVNANGVDHHVLEWSADPARVGEGGTAGTAFLLHGFADSAASWDLVAPLLAEAGHRVVAPDLRGFGDSARVPPGAYYHFADYVFDVADLVDALVPAGDPLFLVGHSMGGTVATLYAGTFAERITRAAFLEGAGPPDNPHDLVPQRMRKWVEDVRLVRSREPRAMESLAQALDRLAANHPRVPAEVLRTRVEQLARATADGRFTWKYDPLHTTRSPVPFFAETYKAFARRVTCPSLFVSGGPLGWHPPDEEDRLAAFPRLARVTLEDAGHMMHWTRAPELARALLDFFTCTDSP
jgi:pimeloyl-ACP methyl ester carboxylesterase